MEIHRDWSVFMEMGWRMFRSKFREMSIWSAETVISSTNYGPVKGVKRKTIYDIKYFSFEGVPFAKPPLGKLRFRAPQPLEPWQGVLDCTKAKPKPLQKNLFTGFAEGSEDCLYLNIYVKQFDTSKRLPVLVYIHGGGFQTGEATRDVSGPDYLMNHNIVVVTITYRQGSFGFLSLKDPELDIPGNAGLKDQIMALKWIKSNIHYFNGDENNITVLGHSAGASSLHIIMCCERARGLFHKAILMSGTALCSFALYPERNWAIRLAITLGYNGPNNDRDILDFLENFDAIKIARVHSNLLSRRDRVDRLNAPCGPIVEPYSTEHTVIAAPILELLKTAWGNKIPIILSGTSDETIFFRENALRFPYLVNELGSCETLLPDDLPNSITLSEKKDLGLKLKKVYFKNEEPSITKHMSEYIDLLNFRYFWHGIHRTVQSRLVYAADAPTFLYRFDYDSPKDNYCRLLWCGRNIRGACHSGDIINLFHLNISRKHLKGSKEYEIMQILTEIVVNFAISSNPNCNAIKPTIWKTINEKKDEKIRLLNIGENVKMIETPEMEKLKLWNSLYKNYPLY